LGNVKTRESKNRLFDPIFFSGKRGLPLFSKRFILVERGREGGRDAESAIRRGCAGSLRLDSERRREVVGGLVLISKVEPNRSEPGR